MHDSVDSRLIHRWNRAETVSRRLGPILGAATAEILVVASQLLLVSCLKVSST